MREEPIHLVPYDATWPRRFEEERAELARALSPWLEGPIEHIGSTAVPGLTAKPVIDMRRVLRLALLRATRRSHLPHGEPLMSIKSIFRSD